MGPSVSKTFNVKPTIDTIHYFMVCGDWIKNSWEHQFWFQQTSFQNFWNKLLNFVLIVLFLNEKPLIL